MYPVSTRAKARVLSVIQTAEQPIAMADIAAAVRYSRRTVLRAIGDLRQLGVIQARHCGPYGNKYDVDLELALALDLLD